MAVDWPAIGAVLLLVGGTFLGVGLAAYDLRGRPLRLAGVAFLAALCAGTANEISYRSQLREQLAGPTLRALAPPSSEETMALREELELHFDGLDLADLAAGDIRQLEPSDLAFELWQRSPLARGRAVSAVSLRGDDGTRLTFSFGVPLDGSGRPQVQSRERPFDRPVWDYTLINEVAAVVLDQRPWGEIEYWLLVRPGFRLAAKRLDDVEGDLLQGGPSGRGAVQDQVRPASYAHYSSPRQVRITPWSEAPELPAEVIARGGGRIVTPDGPSWVWTAAEAEGWRALFLARLGPISAFERVGTEAIGTLWPLAIGLLAVFALGLSRRDFRERASDLWHSYSRRLVLLFSLLVLVPAVLVNVLVLRMLTDRIENEQLTKARRAMTAAQRVLGEYATTPDAGTSLNTIFDDDLMGWLAQVLDHEIHLYWATSGLLSASSQQELFGAGFLPKRIPGEVYAGLRLRGQRSASRVHRTGPTRYTELYGRLTVPGQDPQRADFLLSIPLLAQEVAVAAEIEAIRHPLVLGTTLLVLLLVALGARLAANFTTPLEELVEGTQRIAAGAESLDLEPKERELATLVDAIDRMAERIADGRRKLVQEKRVIERMVDNITAAVVSIDADHRVLMHNETARDLLGTTIGATLESAFAEGENPGKVLDGLRRSEKLGEPQAVRLPTGDEDETREWSLVWVPIPGEGEPKALVVVEDVTAVVRGQRLEAWAEMARIIAHEIKNPLTPIRLSAEHMRSLRERDPAGFDRVFDQCIDNILEHVEELRVISIEFSTYSRALSIEPEVGDLGARVRELVAGYEVVQPDGVTVSFEEEDPVITAFDGRLLMRALRNLIENALRAVSGGGAVSVSVRRGEDGATITVSDTGPGVASAELGKIFDPYFSTHDSGTGLGLPIARRIVEEHGGEIHARNRQAGGLAVRVTLPLTESA
ncbi:MAG: ATP-binding protein [Acidobacteria bacterium]|nr:ATP-binding protein [Acidobacteriota bacterium]